MVDPVSALGPDSGATEVQVPPLPPGREVHLPGRGTTFVRELPGPHPGAPVVMLLHGWTATADLNFFAAYEALGQHFRVIALDHRGHGRGIRARKPFRLADCADDAACLASELGVSKFVPIGYSMGGPIAMLLWRRHPASVQGLVLCATAGHFSHTRTERMSFLGLTGLGALSRLAPTQARSWVTEQVYLRRKVEQWEPWAVQEATRHDWRMVLEAGAAIGTFSARPWLADIDVPTAVVLTMRDPVIPVHRQVQLAESIPAARAYRVDAEHDAIVAHAHRMVPTIVDATHQVLRHPHLHPSPGTEVTAAGEPTS